MNDDRKLLELAAKAARIRLEWIGDTAFDCTNLKAGKPVYKGPMWSPLFDDGDALRLAVQMRLQVSSARRVVVSTHSKSVEIAEEFGSDDCAATRRAIVRAAAEIGKAMP